MEDLPAPFPSRSKKTSLWRQNITLAIFTRLPSRYQTGRPRSRSKSKILPPGQQSVGDLKTSFSFWDGIRDLQKHKWQTSDIQYFILAGLSLFSISVAPSAPLIKCLAIVAVAWLSLTPATRQCFLPSAPIWVWLLYFFCSRFIPYDYRPHIWVRVLPALENVVYGANLSNILSAHKHPILDILAWLPYGIVHFAAPAICPLLMFIFGAPGSAPAFARTFGWMCIIGVTIQLVFPCTPPWYENENGLVPAAYGMPGSPAGLARVDKIFGVDLYTTTFTTAPLPFGAFPSLHSGNAVLEALFMTHCFPQFRTLFIAYTGWIWWSTMYLSHHYAIDLVGGALIAAAGYYYARATFLPKRQADKLTRWEYEYVEVGNNNTIVDEEQGQYFGLGLIEPRRADSMDGWTLASSSSYTSGSGTLSPALSDDTFSSVLSDQSGQGWGQREVDLGSVIVR
jgi:membrane-associated phospholipid phosphatase